MGEPEKRRVIVSASEDPYWNLAAEEYLLDTLPEDTRILLLYTNGPAVIIGKHQNPWLEVNLPELFRRNVVLLRRISGGGTVYHDRGNLNFSFLSAKDGFDRHRNLEFIGGVLRSAGIDTRITDTHDLHAGGKKISGNAFCFRRNHVVHHGTLLVNTDLSLLRRLLSPPELLIGTHAVRSKPAETVNLNSLEHGITPDALVRDMTKAYLGGPTDVETISQEDFNSDEVGELNKRNRAWEWNFGRTPDFELKLPGFTFSIRKGIVDAVEGTLPEALEPLAGTPLRKADLVRYLHTAAATEGEAAVRALYSISV